jgi:hypothetical protein
VRRSGEHGLKFPSGDGFHSLEARPRDRVEI